MAKTKISEFSSTPANNTDIDSINIAEGCAPSGINDAIRELMAQLKDFQTGAVGDSFNGPIGTSTAAAGAFTTLSATGAITSTLATGTAPLVIASTTKVANLNVDLLDGADWAAPAALGSTTPAAVSATTLAASGAVTLSGGTANGVAYLNGSKVVTSGSALTFDGTNLSVDGSANTVAYKLKYNGSEIGFFQNYQNSEINFGSKVNAPILFYINNTEQMRLNSTGLGIGTSSPNQKLTVNGGAVRIKNGSDGSAPNNGILLDNDAVSATNYLPAINWNTGTLTWATIDGFRPSAGGFGGTLRFNTMDTSGVNTERMRIDSAGTLFVNSTARPSGIGGGDNGKLWVKQTTTGNYGIVSIASATDSFISIANTGTVGLIGTSYGTTGSYLPLAFYTSDLERARITASGDLLVGTTTAAGKLTVANTYTNTSDATIVASSSIPGINLRTPSTGRFSILSSYNANNSTSFVVGSGTSNPSTVAMYFDHTTGNIGVGTTGPVTQLQVNSGSSYVGGFKSTVANGFIALQDSGTSGALTDGNVAIGAISNDLAFRSGGATRMRLDSAGNLGLGVTPSAWISGYTSFDVGSTASLLSTGSVTWVGNNWYVKNTGVDTYKTTNYATRYAQSASTGQHQWFTAASGTAGNAITFTQAMTLNANGVLLVGRTSPSISGVKIDAEGLFGSIKSGDWSWSFGASASTYAFVINDTTSGSSVERCRIDSSGNLLVGATSQFGGADCKLQGKNGSSAQAVSFLWNATTTGDANFVAFGTEASVTQRGSITYNRAGGLTVYNTTSDYRAKDITGSVTDSGSIIDSVPVYMGKMKDATQERPMFIAHETPDYAHTGEKDAVDADGNPIYQQMDASALIPVMWAEIQSLRKRLADAGI